MKKKPIAVISSPNTTTTFQVDILEEFIGAPLEGMIVYFDVNEKDGVEERQKRVVCQLFGMQGINRWHEDPIMKSVIKKQGALQFLSGESDTKFATLKTMGVFTVSNNITRTMLNTPPSSGTNVFLADANVIEGLVKGDQGIYYPGVIYASETPVPTYLRHFGPVDEGGYGEAMLIGTFGQSGYGKSVISATLVAGFAVNRKMGLLIIDPAGEFSDDAFGRDSHLEFHFHRLLRSAGRHPTIKKINEVALESPYPFAELLMREKFFDNVGFKTKDKQEQARDRAINYLREMEVDLSKLGRSPANELNLGVLEFKQKEAAGLDEANNSEPSNDKKEDEFIFEEPEVGLTSFLLDLAGAANFIYARKPNKPREKEENILAQIISDQVLQRKLTTVWQKVCEYFDTRGRKPLSDFIKMVLEQDEVVMLNLKDEGDQPYFLINEIFGRLRQVFRSRFGENRKANALIVLDEAHYYAPQDPGNDPDKQRTAKYLREIAKISRKYGVGWFFINQRIADFDKDVFSQLHVRVFAQGLAIGADEANMVSIVGRDAFSRYADLPDAKMTEVYPFMLQGRIVALGTGQSPIILQGFGSTNEILKQNSHVYGKSPEMPKNERVNLLRGEPEKGID